MHLQTAEESVEEVFGMRVDPLRIAHHRILESAEGRKAARLVSDSKAARVLQPRIWSC